MSHFKDAAKDWDKTSTVERNRLFAEAIVSHLNPGNKKLRILDFGCGTGLLSQFLVDYAQDIVGIDTTDEMLQEFDKKFTEFKRAKSINVNLETNDIPSEMGKFDLIISAMAFHHLNQPKNVLAKLKSRLNPNGLIFILDLDKEDGTFHPDNAKMGVKHFGFAQEEQEAWGKDLALHFDRSIVMKMNKNEKEYAIAMAKYS